jgi:MarR family 2-MHQ and catechol resistance regulon transcriptional repressor
MAATTSAPLADLRDEFPASPARDAVVAIVRAYGVVQRLMEPYFAGFDLTPPQFQVLTIVNRLRSEPLTQRRLARELYVSFPNVTVLLGRLEKKGLIQRSADASDRRQKFVRLTRQGRNLLLRVWQVHQQQLDHVMGGLTVPEQQELARLLNQMIAAHAQA